MPGSPVGALGEERDVRAAVFVVHRCLTHERRGPTQRGAALRKDDAAAYVWIGLGLDPEAQHVLRTLVHLDVQLRANLRAE